MGVSGASYSGLFSNAADERNEEGSKRAASSLKQSNDAYLPCLPDSDTPTPSLRYSSCMMMHAMQVVAISVPPAGRHCSSAVAPISYQVHALLEGGFGCLMVF